MAVPISEALRINKPPRLAFVGAGGKSGLMFRLARELAGPVLVTATTHLSTAQLNQADRHFLIVDAGDIPASGEELPAGVNIFTGGLVEPERVSGLSPAALERLLSLAERLDAPLLIEADGSRQRPLKAPASHEPAIPAFVDTVAVVAGLSGLQKPLSPDWVHRPELFAALSGAAAGDRVTPEHLLKVLLHPEGGLKAIPAGARRIAILNQVDSPELLSAVQEMAGKPYSNREGLLSGYQAVLACENGAAQAVFEPAAGIILAGGEARRWREQGGARPKQLFRVEGKPLVRRAAELALLAGLSQVIVVTGAHAGDIRRAVEDLPVTLVHNPDWKEGMSTSMKAGLHALPGETQAAVFFLADQPFIPLALVRGLLEIHARQRALLAAPTVRGKRKNPVLFDRALFPELLKITGDEGGRSLFRPGSPYEPAWLEWDDERAFVDIDTIEDSEKIRENHERSIG